MASTTTTKRAAEAPIARIVETTVPVLEVGGTHVTAALVRLDKKRFTLEHVGRRALDSTASAAELLDLLAEAAATVPGTGGATWGVAIPGPFDYAYGVGAYRGMEKFEALDGVDVGGQLTRRLGSRFTRARYLNDADAFGIGEHRHGAAKGHPRAICITLGTGIGSAFLADGIPVHTKVTVPPNGELHRLSLDAAPLEQTVSRAAIRRLYMQLRNDPDEPAKAAHDHAVSDATVGSAVIPDVHEIAARARAGEPAAARAISEPLVALGRVMSHWCSVFGSDVLVVGGSISTSWDLVEPALRRGLAVGSRRRQSGAASAVTPRLRRPERPEHAALIGAAVHVQPETVLR